MKNDRQENFYMGLKSVESTCDYVVVVQRFLISTVLSYMYKVYTILVNVFTLLTQGRHCWWRNNF